MNTGEGSVRGRSRGTRLGQFIEEAGRRRVWRTAFTYAAIVFVLLQLGEIVFPAFEAPDWALRVLVVASFLGFPVVLALAWVFDLTASGLHRSGSDADHEKAFTYSGTALPRLALLGVTLISVAGVGAWALQDTLGAEANPAEASSAATPASVGLDDTELQIRSLAVLPLGDFSEVEGGEYFTAGFHEELVSQLSQLGAARVISRTSVVQYDATGKSMPTIAADLGVEGVIEGSVFRDGNRVRITVQLIHGPTDQHIWANSYDGTLEDAIGLQRTIAQAITKEIRTELFPDEKWETPTNRVASTPRVQEEYMKGRFSQSEATTESLERAIGHFEAALEEDSGFAPAYASLAGARLLLDLQSGDSLDRSIQTDPEIVEPLEMAFRLDEESPEAQAVFLTIKGALGAIPEMELPAGVQILGDSASILEAEIALTSTEFGRQLQRFMVREGHENPRKARIDPDQRLENARRLQAASEFGAAEEAIRVTIEEQPHSEAAWDALEHLRAVQRDFAGAARIREERYTHISAAPKALESLEDLKNRLENEGEEGYWSWRVEELEAARSQGKKFSPVLLARAYVGLHQIDDAFRELQTGVKARDRNLITLWTDPAWDSLRGDPRFRSILAEVRKREPELL
jgi:TolB-like protein